MNRAKTKTRQRNRHTRRNQQWRSGHQHQLRFENLEHRLLLNADPVVGWEPPAALNSYASTDAIGDNFPQLATDSSGNWIAVWSSSINLDGTLGDDSDILYSRSEDNGVTWSEAAPLNNNAAMDTGIDIKPQVATDLAGTWFASWYSRDSLSGTIGEDLDILYSCSTNNGETWSDPTPLNTNAGTDLGHDLAPELTTDYSGNWIAIWYSYNTLGDTIGDDGDIHFSTSTDNGHTWSDPAPLNTNADIDTGNDYDPHLTSDSTGNWIAVWSSLDTLGNTIGDDSDILYSRSENNGLTWSDPLPLSDFADTDSSRDNAPQITTDSDGTWIAVWESEDTLNGTIGDDNDIVFARSTDNGLTWTNAAFLNSDAHDDSILNDYSPQLTTDSSGNWIAVWEAHKIQEVGIDPPDRDIFFSQSIDDGQTWTEPVPANILANEDSAGDTDAQIVVDSSGNGILVWSSADTLGGTLGTDYDYDILYTKLTYLAAPKTYHSTNTPISIRDAGPRSARETVSVVNIANTEDQVGSLTLELSIKHTDPSDLSGYLVSPAGTSVQLFDCQDTIPNKFYLSGDYYEESIDGTWTLEIWDHYRGDTGTIDSWSLTVSAQLGSLPPEITSTPITSATEDAAYSYDVDATDPDEGVTLTFSLDTAPAGMTINADSGLIEWTPTNDQVGINAVVVRVTDSGSAYDTQSFNIAVANTNDAPVANDDVAITEQNVAATIDVLANDTDVDGDTKTVTDVTPPANGSLMINADSTVTYTPVTDFTGTDTFAYTVSDGNGGTASATVTVNVQAPNIDVALFVSEIFFEPDRGDRDWRAVFQIRCDSDGDGVGELDDEVVAGVAITVEFAGRTFTGFTDSQGIFRTDFVRNLKSGSYNAEVVDLALANYYWDPLEGLDLEEDSDGDGLPDNVLYR